LNFTTWLSNIISEQPEYEIVPNLEPILEEEREKEEEEIEEREEEEEETEETEEREEIEEREKIEEREEEEEREKIEEREEEEEREKEDETEEEEEEREKEDFINLSKSWQCKQCTIFNTKHEFICQLCNTNKNIVPILEEMMDKICENNTICSFSPNTTNISRMVSVYNADTYMDESDDMSINLNDWAFIEKVKK
jgi:hypothetical protein